MARRSVLSKAQRDRLEELIQLRHYSFVVEVLGDGAVAPSILKSLKANGLYRPQRYDPLRLVFEHGRESLVDANVLQLSQRQFEHFLTRKAAVLTAQEVDALTILRDMFVDLVKSLSDQLRDDVRQALNKADKTMQRALVNRPKTSAYVELEQRKAIAGIARDLGDVTKSMAGKAQRVILTETNNAFQDGRAQEILSKSGVDDPLVFKRPRHDACDACKKSYLEDDGVTPRVFRMSELVENGSNIGKSMHERLPCIESHHPHCACTLHQLQRGFGFNKKGELVYVGVGAA